MYLKKECWAEIYIYVLFQVHNLISTSRRKCRLTRVRFNIMATTSTSSWIHNSSAGSYSSWSSKISWPDWVILVTLPPLSAPVVSPTIEIWNLHCCSHISLMSAVPSHLISLLYLCFLLCLKKSGSANEDRCEPVTRKAEKSNSLNNLIQIQVWQLLEQLIRLYACQSSSSNTEP